MTMPEFPPRPRRMMALAGAQTPAAQFLRFLGVGLLNTLFGFLVYSALVLVGIGPLPALAGAFVVGVAFNFQTVGRLVFRNHRRQLFIRFAICSVAVYLVNAVLLHILVDAGLGPIPAQAMLLLPVAVLTFSVNRLFVFSRPGTEETSPH